MSYLSQRNAQVLIKNTSPPQYPECISKTFRSKQTENTLSTVQIFPLCT